MSLASRAWAFIKAAVGGEGSTLSDIAPESVREGMERRIRQDLAIARHSRVVALRECIDICHDNHDVASEAQIQGLLRETVRRAVE